MKNLILVLVTGLIFLAGCTGVKTTATGLNNEAFLEFIGKPNNYKEGLDVTIDDKNTFKAEVNKAHSDRPKGKVYAISTGKHIVTVSYNNNVIFKDFIVYGFID